MNATGALLAVWEAVHTEELRRRPVHRGTVLFFAARTCISRSKRPGASQTLSPSSSSFTAVRLPLPCPATCDHRLSASHPPILQPAALVLPARRLHAWKPTARSLLPPPPSLLPPASSLPSLAPCFQYFPTGQPSAPRIAPQSTLSFINSFIQSIRYSLSQGRGALVRIGSTRPWPRRFWRPGRWWSSRSTRCTRRHSGRRWRARALPRGATHARRSRGECAAQSSAAAGVGMHGIEID